MSYTADESEPGQTYALRLTERAQRDLDATTVHLAEMVSPEVAIAWREGLYEVVASLATFPRRCPRAQERFRREVHQMLYRRPGSQTAHRILFAITGEDVTSAEAPTVMILHIRHASARPITQSQARAIEAES